MPKTREKTTYIQTRMKAGCKLCGQDGALGDVVSVLDAPSAMFWPCMSLLVPRTSTGFLAGISDGGCNFKFPVNSPFW